ncbi:MAG: hypothetical protein HUU20_02150 [Pirellulales bacterium]|nr:hypothetical protein [Pirellulales bacterium]
MVRGMSWVALFGALAVGAVRIAAGQVAGGKDQTAPVRIEALSAQPTPLFVARQPGLRRVVDVGVELSRPATDLVLRVEAGNETFDVPVAEAASSRTTVTEVEAPDFPGPVECKVTATVAGQSRSTSVTLGPQRKWRVYLAASSHTDIGYTHLQPQCAEQHNVNLDDAARLIERYPDFKWNCEVAWQVENYLAARKDSSIEQFQRLAREGKIGVEALYVNILTGLCSHEEFCRMTYFAHGLSRRYGIPCQSAMINDVPTCVASTPMVLANSGIRYFGDGINDARAITFTHMERKSPCWWEGPDGSRVLMMFVRPSFAYALRMGFHTSLEAARKLTLKHLAEYDARDDYPYDAIFFNGASNDNWPIEPKLPQIVEAWNRKYAHPKILFCRYAEFFEYIEKHYADKLPVVRGSGGTYWEDGAGSSARETALCRNAHEAVDNAERMLSLAGRLRPELEYPRQAIDDAWRNCLLYDEHTWGAHTAGTQPESEFTKAQWAIKSRFAHDADRQSAALVDQGARALASLVKTGGDCLVVLNMASWPRTDVVEAALPQGWTIADPSVRSVRVGETTLAAVPEVPACGYRVLKCGPLEEKQGGPLRQDGRERGSREPASPVSGPGDGTTIESRYYRVTFDAASGTVVSLVDKELGRELVDRKAPYRLNQYLYVSGGKDSRIVDPKTKPAEPELAIATSAKARLQRADLGPLGQRMTVETTAARTPRLTCEITVWEDVKRIDVVNRLTKTLTYDKEGVYFAFPFAASNPVLRYEEPAAIVRPDKDFLPGACVSWLTVQHFVELESADAAICWATPDAPLVCFQDINRGKWPADYTATNGHLYAYVMNNYWFTNYLAGQEGDFTFRFAITSRAKADNVASARFGWGAASPMRAVATAPNPLGPLREGSAGLLEISEPNVLLVGMKRSATGEGLVLRLWEVAGRPTTAQVRLALVPFHGARSCSLVEEPQGPLEVRSRSVAVPIRGSGLATVLLE